jgi:N6-L-threonylcarbamoyladenine synthase
MEGPRSMQLLGRTIDDAVGEAYDKAAVILQAGYPGGPKLDKLAQQGSGSECELPRSLLDPESLDFSYSGLKTALLYAVRGKPVGRGRGARFERSAADLTHSQRADFAASFQLAAIDVLIVKLMRAIDQFDARNQRPASIVIGGGVSANSLLRQRITELGEQTGLAVHIPAFAYCLDNAAMIAGLAHADLQADRTDGLALSAVATTDIHS